MAEFTKSVEDVQEESSNQAGRINDMITEFLDSKERIKRREQSREHWKSVSAMLSTSVSARQMKCLELKKREADLRASVSDAMKIIDRKEEELKLLERERIAYLSEQREKFRVKSAMYEDKFLGAYREYTTENLSKNIREIKEECKKIRDEIPERTNKLKILKAQCGFDDLNSRREDEELMKINYILAGVTEDNNFKLLKIAASQDTLNKLRNEIKRKFVMLETMRNK